MTDWKKAQGSQEEKPKEFDTTTSAAVVYQRRNIERVTIEDKMSGETYEVWEYDERELTHSEAAVILSEIQQKQIDEANETALTGLMATTDLYEELIEKGVLD